MGGSLDGPVANASDEACCCAGKNFFAVFNGVEIAANALIGTVSAASISSQSSVIDVKLQTQVPEKGKDVLNTLFAVYNEYAITDKNQTAAKTLAFIEDRLRLVIDQLDSVHIKLRPVVL